MSEGTSLSLGTSLRCAYDRYDPPEPYKSKDASAPYDGEIAYADSAVGKLLTELRASGTDEGSLIAVMADHGEGLGDHGETTHGLFLYDATIHVPLLLKLPQERSGGTRVEKRVELVDVLPTMLQEAGIDVAGAEGEFLDFCVSRNASRTSCNARATIRIVPLDGARCGRCEPASICSLRRRARSSTTNRRIRRQSITYPRRPWPATSTFTSQLDAFREKTSTSKEAPKVSADPELQEERSASGSAADSSSSATLGVKDTGADPEDKVQVVNLLHAAETFKEEEQFQQAVPLLEQVIALEPNLPITYLQLGTALSSLKNYQKAGAGLQSGRDASRLYQLRGIS